jgi:hypothetical protein
MPAPGSILSAGTAARAARSTIEDTMADAKSDQSVLKHIGQLVEEEKALHASGAQSDPEKKRLAHLKVELDQCWDLLRQRRALREFGEDPDSAKVRPASVVENYKQ